MGAAEKIVAGGRVRMYSTTFSACRDDINLDDGQYIRVRTQLDLSTQNFLPADMALLASFFPHDTIIWYLKTTVASRAIAKHADLARHILVHCQSRHCFVECHRTPSPSHASEPLLSPSRWHSTEQKLPATITVRTPCIFWPFLYSFVY